jgi:hypothetical protein
MCAKSIAKIVYFLIRPVKAIFGFCELKIFFMLASGLPVYSQSPAYQYG